MGDLISFHPPKSDLVLLYEVVDDWGNAEWGGNSEREALAWVANSPTAKRILVSRPRFLTASKRFKDPIVLVSKARAGEVKDSGTKAWAAKW